MGKEKKYLSFTGLTDFYYGVLDGVKIKDAEAERIKFLQDINISTDQSIEKAYGDNGVAEMAVATGTTSLTTQFHKLPLEDRTVIYGMEEVEEIVGVSANPEPPYVACMFSRTSEDGSREHIAFTKGKFMMADIAGQTKGESVEFGNDSTEGEFMAREVDGFDKLMTMLIVADEPGATTNRDKLYEKVFGVAFPTEGV